MALSADRKGAYREGIEVDYPVKDNVKIFAGSLVCVDSTGYAVVGANTSGFRFVGVAILQADNTGVGHAAGAVSVRVRRRGTFLFNATSILQAHVGTNMYLVDDCTFDNVDPGQAIICGKLQKFLTTTTGWISIDEATSPPTTPAAADNLTVSDAGAFFPATALTVATQIQILGSVPIVIPIPRFTGWTKDGTAKTPVIPLLELPVPVRIKRAYCNLGTAPGTGKTFAALVNTSAAVSIAETATQGEGESLDIAIAANTDIVITVTETAGGAGANCDLILIAVLDDGE